MEAFGPRDEVLRKISSQPAALRNVSKAEAVSENAPSEEEAA
jgi:hypothetical protein